jgi:CubicO group peptidase (beta-lactamase class C family)
MSKLLAVLLMSSLAAAAAERWQPLGATIEQFRIRHRIPGMAAAIVEDGRVVWSGSYGNLTTQSRVNIASLTKTMGAVLALQEVDAGRLELEDPAPGLRAVRIKHLLSHTSLGRRPGQTFRYSNQRYNRLTSVLEHSARASVPELLHERIFERAGMINTRPARYVSGGVVSTVEDLARYAAALDGEALLGDEAKKRMWTPLKRSLPYAYGWFVQGSGSERIAWHYGRLNGASSLIVKVPSRRLSLVVLANSGALATAFAGGNVSLSPVGRSFLRCGSLGRPCRSAPVTYSKRHAPARPRPPAGRMRSRAARR